MRCPFRYRRRRRRYTFGVSADFIEYVEAEEAREEAEYDAAYPTCWAKFLHWLGAR